MTQPIKELSVILPAYNEEGEIQENTHRLKDHLDRLHIDYEILIVDDGSKDNTVREASCCESKNIRVLTYPDNRGKGYAIQYGMLNATGAYRLFMDVDLSTSLGSIEQFLQLIRSGQFDIIIGNRKTNPSLQKIRQPFYRRFFGEGFTRLSSLMIGERFTDFTCGFKMYTKKTAEIIFRKQRIFDWAFDAELIYIALLHNLRIYEAPVVWKHHPDSRVRLLRDIVNSFYSLVEMRVNGWQGRYR
jgi:dolichyl-phosphate beta-glucosyltransferase